MCPETEEEKREVKKLPCNNLIGSLIYLAVSTRSDIAHAVSRLSQYSNFGHQWAAAKRILRSKRLRPCILQEIWRKTRGLRSRRLGCKRG